MLFTTYTFLLGFLPATLIPSVVLHQLFGHRASLVWIICCSLFFHAYATVWFVAVLLVSIVSNFFAGSLLVKLPDGLLRRLVLTASIGGNLAALAYYKYSNFFLSQIGIDNKFIEIALPIGISFFTFKQIAFLMDNYRREAAELDFLRYTFFVSFFPYLIAGPIVHHREVMPQVGQPRHGKIAEDVAVGLTVMGIGLFKKLVFADHLAIGADGVFLAAAGGQPLGMASAWYGALCYCFQIYFDFSGYTDIATGVARMFGVRLPVNFASPYKARSIIDFWRRWHISLSRFLRDYLYFPLGGGRVGPRRRLVNLLLVMVLGGFWHGANWTFALWGAIHGILLIANHLVRERLSLSVPPVLAWAATFMLVTIAWVPFRAPDMGSAVYLLQEMFGLGRSGAVGASEFIGVKQLGLLALALPWVAFLPNTHTLMRQAKISLQTAGYPATRPDPSSVMWRLTLPHAMMAGITLFAILLFLRNASTFIYFQF